MDITPLIGAGQQVIQAYGKGRFRINGTLYEHPVIVLPLETMEWAAASPAEALTERDFVPLMDRAGEIDVLLFGSGPASGRPGPGTLKALKAGGLAVECMDTGAACRTYNVLMTEGRRVAAALLPL